MSTHIPNYIKMTQLWVKDKAIGDHAKTSNEKRARYATLSTIDDIDIMVSQTQNRVSLEDFEVKEDYQ